MFINKSVDHLRRYMVSRKAVQPTTSTRTRPRLTPVDSHELELELSPPPATTQNAESALPCEGPSLAVSKLDGGIYDFEHNNGYKYENGTNRKDECEYTFDGIATSGATEGGRKNEYERSSTLAAAAETEAGKVDGLDVASACNINAPGTPETNSNGEMPIVSQKSPTQVSGSSQRTTLQTNNQSFSTITPFSEGASGFKNEESTTDTDSLESGRYVMSSADWDMPSMGNLGVSTKMNIALSEKQA